MKKDSLPKYKVVEEAIIKAIQDERILNKLPGERTLAAEFGFSYMTVRKAINNLVNRGVLYKVPSKGAFVNTEQASPSTATIGYFIDKRIKLGISSPYYSMIYNAIEKEAAQHDYTVLYFSNSDPDRLNKVLAKVDGVIATCFPHNEDIIAHMKKQLPVLVIDNASKDPTIPSVVIDNFTADYNTVRYLQRLGHKRIGFMTGLNDSDVGRNRFNGYKQGVADFHLVQDEALIHYGNYSFESGVEGAEYFLGLPTLPDAIICANDSMALGAIQYLKACGMRIPEDISIIGFDNIQVASQVSPALTTIAAPTEEIALHAFTMLKQQIDDKPMTYMHLSLSAHMIERASCADRSTKA
ncbi:MAG: GntR family transcriptional regulator [Thiotrichales bacterium]|nr:GntR family transcriptional regulator [Thiotrichales bacterium]